MKGRRCRYDDAIVTVLEASGDWYGGPMDPEPAWLVRFDDGSVCRVPESCLEPIG